MGLPRILAATVILAAVAGGALAASKQTSARGDRVWTHADFASFGVDRIAMIPAVTFDKNFEAEKQVERAVGKALGSNGYRWIAATSARFLHRATTGGDSALDAIRARALAKGRVDSLDAPGLCARLRCDAVLGVRVDLWEQREVEWNQSGKPTTTVQLRATLVDSTGHLLWSAEGSQTAEGPYHNPQANPLGVSESGLNRKPITGQGSAPSFMEVLDSMMDRWAGRFPARKSAAAPDSAKSATTPDR